MGEDTITRLVIVASTTVAAAMDNVRACEQVVVSAAERLTVEPGADSTADLFDAVAGLHEARRGLRAARSAQRIAQDLASLDDVRPCGHRDEDACEACVPSLVALAVTHDPTRCRSASDCTCSCTPCMRDHEGALP
ncbi:hypothetical protein [Cellulomonas composti]|uniref:Uncharacterized protein n=1 Tax=Cellulomonas composti TaxID=266130 RepID=A0A511JBQ6_9CELL|nr:hypothetical protein [Cellulomonas composti]GEL95394.1 hypothetical protein CCO02nite_20520 [Cellulomonas composti]